jgi:hypothetical protein
MFLKIKQLLFFIVSQQLLILEKVLTERGEHIE